MAKKTIPQLTETATILDNGVLAYDNGAQTFKTKASTLKTYVEADSPARISALEKSFANLGAQNWFKQSFGATDNWNSIKSHPTINQMIAVGSGATNRVARSGDGIDWTFVTPSQANPWQDVAYSPSLGIWAAVANSGTNRVMTSTNVNGTAWVNQTAASALPWSRIIWIEQLGLFVAIAETTARTDCIMTSENGTGWTIRNLPEAVTAYDICWSSELGRLVLTGNGSGTADSYYSSDAINWSPCVGASGTVQYRGLAYGNGIFAAVGNVGNMNSVDGINWTQNSSDNSFPTDRLAYSPELKVFVAARSSGSVYYSFNGLNYFVFNWGANLNSIHWNSRIGTFFIPSNGGVFYRSLALLNRV